MRYSDYSVGQNVADGYVRLNMAKSKAAQNVKKYAGAAKNIAKEAYKNPGAAASYAGKQIMANKGKAGLALGALAAAGGLGIAGMKAMGARKKKANSLQGRLADAVNKNPTLSKASKMFR